MTGTGDPAVQAHLARVAALYAEAGAIEYLQNVVRQTWRANRRRWSPNGHFDDTNTLGYQTSRNVSNRIVRTIETSNVNPTVLLETEPGVVILGLAGFRLRVVKAPIESALAPDFENDFDWSASATREAAARRNSNNYYPFAVDELAFELDDDPRPKHRRQVDACRDVFLVWAAGLASARTAGWLGLPRMGDTPWMGVLQLWLDPKAPPADGDNADGEVGPDDAPDGLAYVDEDEDEDDE
jgi:hypothetical protein